MRCCGVVSNLTNLNKSAEMNSCFFFFYSKLGTSSKGSHYNGIHESSK